MLCTFLKNIAFLSKPSTISISGSSVGDPETALLKGLENIYIPRVTVSNSELNLTTGCKVLSSSWSVKDRVWSIQMS